MNWFKQMIVRWVREDWDEARNQNKVPFEANAIRIGLSKDRVGTTMSANNVDSSPTLQFKVWNAVGGRVVEFTRYDERHERTQHSVYIVADDQDFGSRIAKIATMESLKG